MKEWTVAEQEISSGDLGLDRGGVGTAWEVWQEDDQRVTVALEDSLKTEKADEADSKGTTGLRAVSKAEPLWRSGSRPAMEEEPPLEVSYEADKEDRIALEFR